MSITYLLILTRYIQVFFIKLIGFTKYLTKIKLLNNNGISFVIHNSIISVCVVAGFYIPTDCNFIFTSFIDGHPIHVNFLMISIVFTYYRNRSQFRDSRKDRVYMHFPIKVSLTM